MLSVKNPGEWLKHVCGISVFAVTPTHCCVWQSGTKPEDNRSRGLIYFYFSTLPFLNSKHKLAMLTTWLVFHPNFFPSSVLVMTGTIELNVHYVKNGDVSPFQQRKNGFKLFTQTLYLELYNRTSELHSEFTFTVENISPKPAALQFHTPTTKYIPGTNYREKLPLKKQNRNAVWGESSDSSLDPTFVQILAYCFVVLDFGVFACAVLFQNFGV